MLYREEDIEMPKTRKQIILGDILPSNIKILSGREEGKRARLHYNLDEIDQQDIEVEVNIPSKFWTISSSYFLGCFGKSVRNLGVEGFKKKYQFKCDPIFEPNIEDGIARSVNTTGVL